MWITISLEGETLVHALINRHSSAPRKVGLLEWGKKRALCSKPIPASSNARGNIRRDWNNRGDTLCHDSLILAKQPTITCRFLLHL